MINLQPFFSSKDPKSYDRNDNGHRHDHDKCKGAFGKRKINVHAIDAGDHGGDI